MTEQEAKTLPLWEVWERFNASLDLIELDDPNAPDTTMGGKWGTPPGVHGRMAAKMVPMLRAVLLERCKRVEDENGWTLLFESMDEIIDGMEDGPMKAVYAPTAKGKYRIRCDRAIDPWFNADGLREVSAITAFLAWELEQRKEVKGEQS